jgi:hypothetical protein
VHQSFEHLALSHRRVVWAQRYECIHAKEKHNAVCRGRRGCRRPGSFCLRAGKTGHGRSTDRFRDTLLPVLPARWFIGLRIAVHRLHRHDEKSKGFRRRFPFVVLPNESVRGLVCLARREAGFGALVHDAQRTGRHTRTDQNEPSAHRHDRAGPSWDRRSIPMRPTKMPAHREERATCGMSVRAARAQLEPGRTRRIASRRARARRRNQRAGSRSQQQLPRPSRTLPTPGQCLGVALFRPP